MNRNLRPSEVRFGRTVEKTVITTLVALVALVSGIKIGQNQEKKNTEKILLSKNEIEKRAEYFQKDAANLATQNIELKRYSNDAQTLAESMKFYPTEPDSISALPEEEQEKAMEKTLEEDEKKRIKHDSALKHLGVDTNLLFRVQRGPKLPE